MDEGAEGAFLQLEDEVEQGDERPCDPRIARVDNAIEPAGTLGGAFDHVDHIGVAAQHPVEGDDIRRFDLRGEIDEVAVPEAGAIGKALAGSLLPCGVDIGL